MLFGKVKKAKFRQVPRSLVNGLSIRAANEREAVSAMWSLTDDKQKAEKMRAMQRACINPNAADDIAAKVAEGWI